MEDLTSEVGVSGDQQRTLLSAISSLDRLVASGIQSDQAVTRQLTDAVKSLADAADKSMAGSEAAAQAGRCNDAVPGIAEVSTTLATSQARVENAIAAEGEANTRLADSLAAAPVASRRRPRRFPRFRLVSICSATRLSRIVQLSSEQSTTLSRLLTRAKTPSRLVSVRSPAT